MQGRLHRSFVAAFMLAAVGTIHLAVLPGIIEPHLRNVAIEMALLALLLAVASTAVGVMGIMVVCHNYDAKRLFLASSGLAAFAIVGVLLAKFVIRGIFGMGSLTRPGMLVVLCSAVIAFACAQMLPRKSVAEDAEAEPDKDAESDGAKNSAEDAAEGLVELANKKEKLLPELSYEEATELMAALDKVIAPLVAMGLDEDRGPRGGRDDRGGRGGRGGFGCFILIFSHVHILPFCKRRRAARRSHA